MKTLRPYQVTAEGSILHEFEQKRSTLLHLATGLGKTSVASSVIKSMQPGRALFLAHTDELIAQAVASIQEWTGLPVAIEKADLYASNDLFNRTPVIISSIQTQISGKKDNRRFKRFKPEDFSLLICDEAHLSVSPSWRETIAHYQQNPKLKLLGLTATPKRTDEQAMNQVYESVAMSYGILDGIADGWLVDIVQQFVPVKGLDFSHIKTTGGDLNEGQLAEVMEQESNIQGICQPVLEAMFGLAPKTLHELPPTEWKGFLSGLNLKPRRTLIYTVSVAQAEMCCNVFLRALDDMEWLCGKTNKQTRRDMIARFAKGATHGLVNVGCLCLDAETEILTSNGWVGIDDMSYDCEVANWRLADGQVFFAQPRFIIKRDRRPNERMVVLETKNRSIRVTEDHNMIVRKRPGSGAWFKLFAKDAVGRMLELPISGCAAPLPLCAPEAEPKSSTLKRRLAANSYVLRQSGLNPTEAKLEAFRRIGARDSMRHKAPHELSDAECELVGFWLGDGAIHPLSGSANASYDLVQSIACPNIIGRIDALITQCGFHSRRRLSAERRVIIWQLPRGTGHGPQKRNGLFAIEPYLDKAGSPLLWGLNEWQFACLINGYWMADGADHFDNTKAPKLIQIVGARKRTFDLLQAIACVRGYRASLRVKDNRGLPLYMLSMTKKDAHDMTKFTLQFERDWRPERVWCVTSDTGNIITRRRGSVTVLGNTHGFDNPQVEVIAVARATKSASLYTQIIGRGTRPLPGIVDGIEKAEDRRAAIAGSAKPFIRVLDFLGNSGKHKLITLSDILGGRVSEAAVEKTRKLLEDGKPRKILVTMSNAQLDLERARREQQQKQREQEESRRRGMLAKSDYSLKEVDPFSRKIAPAMGKPVSRDGRMFSEKQARVLREGGLDPRTVSYRQGQAIIGKLILKPSPGQRAILEKRGFSCDGLTRKECSAKIDAIAQSEGWGKDKTEGHAARLAVAGKECDPF